ncbi:insulin-like growth factor-binding protein-related protein 1 [Oratosquilla oratoria]|uniref:insulin-like growth factor-binding protein-related protein 1 n=1 Tax=Oratosquilla oratoria TaxID=337810 RepID=UPI003F75E7DA
MARALVCAVVLAVVVCAALAEECGECDRSTCPDVSACSSGIRRDSCNCCDVCGLLLGERCENITEGVVASYGPCGDDLVCLSREDTMKEESVCVCEENGFVCGSDNKTYDTPCHLLRESALHNPQLYVTERGPCKQAPVIKTPPSNAKRPLGGIMVLDCEAVGYPIPELYWLLHKDDGSTVKLPSDDSAIAVQVRGGPERFMVTGWVQIMRVDKTNTGSYACVATNSEGEAREVAKVTYFSRKEDEMSVNDL